MPTNVYFTHGTKNEQYLIEDLIIESLKIYGNEFMYIPRTLVSKDEILGEDRLSKFTSSFPIEMYFENVDSLDGQGAFIQKFGLMMEQSATLVVARRRWDQLVGRYGQTIIPTRPCEGDLIYFPLTKGLFEIKFVKHQDPFYQLGKLYVFKLQVELFQYASEKIDTGISEIDAFETLKTFTTNTTRSPAGEITSITMINQGSGYTSVPTVAFAAAPSGGVTATGTAVLSGGGVSAVAVAAGGTGYTSPTITFSPPTVAGGVTAVGTVTVSGGVITGIVITTAGTGYTTAPTATLGSLGTGTGASLGAVTIGTSTITGIVITNAGYGYTVAPAVTITGGGGSGAAATTVIAANVGNVYTIALTGGNITFANNLTYLTPANLGTVNLPITYFTGTRAITGTINAYLKTGSLESGGLLSDLIAGSATTVDPKFTINVQMGGPSTNPTGVEIKLPAAMLQIPTINTEQVISTTINFTAQGFAGTSYDITESNEATIVYRAAV